MKTLTLLFYTLEDNNRRWVDIVKQIPSQFEGYVQGAAKVYVRSILGTLRVLYPAVDLHQVTVEATVERAEEELDGLATIIVKDLDLHMEKHDE